MKTLNKKTVSVLFAVVVALLISSAESKALTWEDTLPFSYTRLYFEMNSTDEDLGIQVMLDGKPWKKLLVFGPNGSLLINIEVEGNAQVAGLTELFNESAEPPLAEFTLREWLMLFPEGNYFFIGLTVDSEFLLGVATFTHDIPDGPEIINPTQRNLVDSNNPLQVKWIPVQDPNPPQSVIEAYEVIVEKDEEGERRRVFKVDMLPTDNCVTVPAEFLEAGKAYKVEVLAIETSDNQTISEISFETE